MTVTRRALDLYRNILRLHEEKLPVVMKSLGNSYVRQEFRIHMYGLKTSESQFDMFLVAWHTYSKKLASQASVIGEALAPEQKKLLNDDQKTKLRMLKDELEKL